MERYVIPVYFAAAATAFWAMPRHWRMAFLSAAFSAVLLWFEPVPIAIMLAMSAATFTIFNVSAMASFRSSWPGMVLVVGSICVYLIVVKYVPALTAPHMSSVDARRIAVPLGLSYLTFRLVHYAVDAREGRLPPHAFDEFMTYAMFLPIFFAGPIERFDRFLAGRSDTLTTTDLWQAMDRFIKGLIKAFALPALILASMPAAAPPGAAASLLSDPAHTSAARIWCVLGVTTLTYYLNFAGYSDIAIGAARLLGFKISENFNNPFLSTSITQFWSRWHITLGEWCRAYVFYPVSRVLRSAALGVLATFAVIGLWHEASLHWLCFGLWHGVGVLAASRFRRRGWILAKNPYLAASAGWLATTAFVTLGSGFTLLSASGSIWDSVRIIALALGLRL